MKKSFTQCFIKRCVKLFYAYNTETTAQNIEFLKWVEFFRN